MPTYEEERRRNLEAYEELREEISAKYKGQYVAIADGRLVKVSPNFEEADDAARGYSHALVFPAGDEPIVGPIRVRGHKTG